MKKWKLLKKVLASTENVRFGDMVTLVEAFGFKLERVTGSHHIFSRPGIAGMLNLQNYKGKAKSYQIRQFLRLIGQH